jgi:MoaA/NifB/PqqE/SkfB family radical SAM enzyme
MNWLENFRIIKVEITSYCNAACPGCIRNITGGKTVNNLDLEHMSLDLWKRIMYNDTSNMELEEVSFDGTIGDFCMNPDAIKFVEIVNSSHPLTNININTNGGARNEKFWSELGTQLAGKPHIVNFAIDGLEDTHHIHRRNTTYNVVVRNMKAFIAAGGQANWVYTLFDHNTHQVEEARQRSIDYKCDSWQVRQSCIDGSDMYTSTKDDQYTIGTDTIRNLPETAEQLNNTNFVGMKTRTDTSGHACTAFNERTIQIDFRGVLWPCSYIYAEEVLGSTPISPFFNETTHPVDQLRLATYTLEEILTGELFVNTVDTAVSNAEWAVCKRNCAIK